MAGAVGGGLQYSFYKEFVNLVKFVMLVYKCTFLRPWSKPLLMLEMFVGLRSRELFIDVVSK